jgi:chemotaxis protein MotB
MPLRRALLVLLVVPTLLASAGCVSRSRYRAAEAEQDWTTTLNRGLTQDLSRSRAQAAEADLRNVSEQDDNDFLHLIVDQLALERAALGVRLDSSDEEIRTARRAQHAAELRALAFRNLALRLKRMTDSGSLSIRFRDGRMVLVLPNDVLFASGSAAISKPGHETLDEVATVLRDVPERRFQVSGHTDDVPIQTASFASNWELSSARSIRVVKLLAEAGIPETSLSAAGYGEFDPIAGNDTPPHRALNRRVEITLLPIINELVTVP